MDDRRFCRRCGQPSDRCRDGSACGRPGHPSRFCGACGGRLREVVVFPGTTALACAEHGHVEPSG